MNRKEQLYYLLMMSSILGSMSNDPFYLSEMIDYELYNTLEPKEDENEKTKKYTK